MDARLEVMHSKRPDRPLLATGRDRAEGRREEKLRELGAHSSARRPKSADKIDGAMTSLFMRPRATASRTNYSIIIAKPIAIGRSTIH
jgi:hypothetical protein